MDPLSVTASIIAVLQLTVKIIEGLKDAKDASADRSQFTTEIQNLRDLLVALLSRVDEDSSDPWHKNVREMGGQDGLIYQYRVALEQLKDNISTGQGVKKMTKTLLWKYIQQDAERILLRIERLKSLVQIALEMDHFMLSQAIESRVSSLQDDSKTIKVGIEAIQQGQDRQNQGHDIQGHYETMEWLSPDSFAAQQSDLITRKQGDTGQWFLESCEFAEWVNGKSQTLFCPGIPGAGKTMMAAIAVHRLQNTVQTADIGVACLYCNYKRQVEQTAPNLVAAIIKQLVQDRPSIAQSLSGLYEHHRGRRTRPTLEELSNILQSVVANYSKVYVVLDALDECPERNGTRSQLLGICRDLQQKTGLRLMDTSRHIPDIVEEFKDSPLIEVRASDSDIKRFVIGNVSRFAKFFRSNSDLQERVQNKIIEAADGMFLLASLHVDSLVSKKTTSRLNSALNSLSHGSGALGDAYNKAIDRIDGQVHDDCTLAKSVLSWISYAQRPLTTKELCHALAVEIGDEDFDSENVTDVEDILSVCAGLVTVDEESQIIRLVHYTTQEYLEGIREAWHPRAQHEIASTCLTYLCFEPFKSGPCPYETDSENRRKKYSLLDYSARYWPEHAAAVQEEICDLAMVLLQDSNLVASAHLHGHGGCPYSLRRQVTGLHLTASSELLHLSRELLSWAKKERMDLANSRDSMGATPLSYAAEGGYKEIVQLLLGTDTVDVDGEDEFGFTPLLYAVKHSHKELVELLLGTGKVDVNAKQRDGWTALLLAVTAGQKEIVELLLGTGKVDVNAKQRDGWTALLLAVNRQQKEIFKLLLGTRKVDVNAKERDGRTALMIAVMEGLREIVELLLDAGKVDAEAKSHGWTPVFVAVREGHKEIVELLLGPGKADVDKTPDRSTLLRYAVGCGYKDLAEFLLGINTDASNITDRWPLLSLVAANRHRSIAELIGSEEIDLDAKLGFEGRTLLMQTTRQRRGDFVAMLLKAGAKSNAKDIDGSTALMEAAEIGGKEVAELLLNAGADIDAKDEEGSTALMMAALKGHQSMVELLLDRGADVHVKNKKGSTAPMEAARHSKKETLELLLDRGADVHAKNEDGLTALIVAARWGHEDTVELLLNKGADVHAQKKNGLTALMAAAKHDQKGIAKLLLDRGIDVHAQKTNGSTALMLAERRRHKDTADFLRAHISYL